VDQASTRKADEPRVGARLWAATRTTSLLLGVGVVAVLMVNLPTSLSSQTRRQASAYVPTSDRWIRLGVEPTDVQGPTRVTPIEGIAARTEGMQEGRPRPKPRGIQLASLGGEIEASSVGSDSPQAAIRWRASAACLHPTLRHVVSEVATNFGPVIVNSTCRSHRHNARVGGAKRSFHLVGNAADFRVEHNPKAVLAFLSAHRTVGGLKHYGGGRFHIDTGPRRTW
jgi:hypothetical protein